MSTSSESQPRRFLGLRFSLRHLFSGMAAIGLGCVALRNASPLWESMMTAGLLLVLVAAMLFIAFRRGSDRAYWIGFASFGWAYGFLLFAGWSFESKRLRNGPLGSDQLLTSQLSETCYHRLFDDAFAQYYAQQAGSQRNGIYGMGSGMPIGSGDYGGGYGSSMGGYDSSMMGSEGMPGTVPGASLPNPGPNAQEFIAVAHTLWALLIAVCGGWLARWMYATGSGKHASTEKAQDAVLSSHPKSGTT